jgi:AAA domain
VLEFFDKIFGQQEGYVYVALFKNGKPIQGGRQFVKWPEKRKSLANLARHSEKGDLYFCPAVFSEARATRQAAIGSLVAWVDVDQAAVSPAQSPSAGLLVASGTPGHVHAYWPSDALLTPRQVEGWNYWAALKYGADMGGWDITQLLRVPGTLNHKTNPPTKVELVHFSDEVFVIPEGVEQLQAPHYTKPHILPSIETVLNGKTLNTETIELMSSTPSDRSSAMFRLACLLSEQEISPDEAFVILSHVDTRWEKFKGRNDRERRLEQLVSQAYAATLSLIDDDTPVGDANSPENRGPTGLAVVGPKSLAKNQPHIVWLVDHILKPGGQVVLASTPGVGKSTMSIGLSMALILGADKWIGYDINQVEDTQQKILYLSLEMSEQDVKYFTSKMMYHMPAEHVDCLEQNLLFHCTLESFKLDVEDKPNAKLRTARQSIEETLAYHAGLGTPFTGIVVDSIGATTSKGLSDDVAVRGTMDWIKTVRSRFGCWVLVLAHNRKISRDAGRRPVLTLDDIFGSQVQQAELDAAFALVKVDGQEGFIDMYSLKSRFGPERRPIRIRRTPELLLELSTQRIEEDVTPSTRGRGGRSSELIDDTEFNPEDWDDGA